MGTKQEQRGLIREVLTVLFGFCNNGLLSSFFTRSCGYCASLIGEQDHPLGRWILTLPNPSSLLPSK